MSPVKKGFLKKANQRADNTNSENTSNESKSPFAGPQAKRKKQERERQAKEIEDAERFASDAAIESQASAFAPPPGFEVPVSDAAQIEIPNRQVEISLEKQVAFELLQVADVLEAMQALEADVQETKGQYEPIEESEMQSIIGGNNSGSGENHGGSLQRLFGTTPLNNQVEYQLELEAEPPIKSVSSAEMGLSFDPQSYRKDTKKTQIMSIPKAGVKRSNRGTIEAVFQPNGNVVEAQYNRCGMLVEVSVAGALKLTRSADTGDWTMSYLDGSHSMNHVSNVAFDRQGNLCYSTDDGQTTVICADGRVVQK